MSIWAAIMSIMLTGWHFVCTYEKQHAWIGGCKESYRLNNEGYYKNSTQQSYPTANICAMCPKYLARGYQGLHVKQANKNKQKNQNKFYS